MRDPEKPTQAPAPEGDDNRVWEPPAHTGIATESRSTINPTIRFMCFCSLKNRKLSARGNCNPWGWCCSHGACWSSHRTADGWDPSTDGISSVGQVGP